ncbi:hypothetical protein [Streptomyces sp. Ncost-T10-10d]|uniref:hypothetical protein n=1 Tax=Streptomyces sp. Ncost-T10-10d TaxID=1839774 RepID=UPI00081EE911|nr:hypothetical protein [Streptomyces sp. Ncost-T10-10d]SCF56936.1 hypothetical protein GA0115254_10378 [Streptomyces sp. Ncost-T10-10d]
MGVLTDYFRAADSASVVRVLEQTDGGSPLFAEPAVFDGVEAKGVDPSVVLAQLIAAIHQIEWRADLLKETTVWPSSPAPVGPISPADEDDPWVTGPWVSELHPPARDTLAGVRDGEVPAIVARWVRAEELRGARVEDMQPLAEELILLARRAQDAGELLYCWMSL